MLAAVQARQRPRSGRRVVSLRSNTASSLPLMLPACCALIWFACLLGSPWRGESAGALDL